ncbi:MAG: hypothetical protein ACK6DZ_05210 [Acidobacteriota bacterium]
MAIGMEAAPPILKGLRLDTSTLTAHRARDWPGLRLGTSVRRSATRRLVRAGAQGQFAVPCATLWVLLGNPAATDRFTIDIFKE